MANAKNILSTRYEPVRTATLTFLAAFAGVLIAFGVDLSTLQLSAISALAVAFFGVMEIFVRGSVIPVEKLSYDGEPATTESEWATVQVPNPPAS